jgi:hypothetical protein
VTDLPRHPDAHDDMDADPSRPAAKRPWLIYVAIAIAVALFVVMIVLHLTGVVGPEAH